MNTFQNESKWTVPYILDYQAEVNPNKVAIEFVSGSRFTFKELRQIGRNLAHKMLANGTEPGNNVALILPNGPAFIDFWLASQYAGCVMVGLNTELKGALLKHALNLSESKTLICDGETLGRVADVLDQLIHIKNLILVGSAESKSLTLAERHPNITVLRYSQLDESKLPSANLPAVRFNDISALLFTSGTSGPSKAVEMPQAHCCLYGQGTIDNLALEKDDKYYVTMPLFHANGLYMQTLACFMAGATAVIRSKFSATKWLSEIAEYRITHTNLLGVMTDFIIRQPDSGNHQPHNLKVVAAAPAPPSAITVFRERFDITLTELYGMSEVNIPLYNPIDSIRPGSCGKVYDKYFEVRIANPETDIECAPEEVGEIQVRPKLPNGFMRAYFRMPEQTANAFRNLWFHTGDAGRYDKDGYFYFVDRIKDCLRRRGENISSYELETIMLELTGLQEVAIFGVPSEFEGGEEEIMAVVVAEDSLSPDAVYQHCKSQLPGFAVPRYFLFVGADELPRTATNKIQKHKLKEQGVTEKTWDTLSTSDPVR